ncbi:MAG: substrate-binding domain-containing protein [Clostridiales Family XIII bacterium]|nr:substrate-binding domain-containing protein [Clostridiales Family XIII bacterium]
MSEDHPVDLFLGTAPSADEFALAESEGVTLVQEPVCWDAFVFIVNARNPVDNLSLDQIRDIYSGEITSWKDVGGRWKAITPYQRNANSGSQTAMESMVMQGEPLMPPIMGEVRTMDGLVEAVADFDNGTGSIGYTFLYYVDEMYKDENIKLLSIDGVAPTEENIRSGAYPLAVNYYAVYREEDEDGTAGKFTEWILSEEGQMVVEQAGYIPMDSGARPE